MSSSTASCRPAAAIFEAGSEGITRINCAIRQPRGRRAETRRPVSGRGNGRGGGRAGRRRPMADARTVRGDANTELVMAWPGAPVKSARIRTIPSARRLLPEPPGARVTIYSGQKAHPRPCSSAAGAHQRQAMLFAKRSGVDRLPDRQPCTAISGAPDAYRETGPDAAPWIWNASTIRRAGERGVGEEARQALAAAEPLQEPADQEMVSGSFPPC